MDQKIFKLTIDYEVFLGSNSGDLQKVLIEPTYELMKLLKINDSKMTVFWDVLHYYRICQLCNDYEELLDQKLRIEKQIKDLVYEGHDIQLHLHPHWLDTFYVNNCWVPNYKRFSLHKFDINKNKNDINTIFGCIFQMKLLMEQLIKPINNQYVVNSFRAGGYLIEPFNLLKETFKELKIQIDSSVCPGLFNDVKEYSYNYINYPNFLSYKFSNSPKFSDENGYFTEYPIHTIKLSFWFRFKKMIFNKFNKNLNEKKIGYGVSFDKNKISIVKKLFNKLFKEGKIQLTLDGVDTYTFKYIYSKSPNNAVMIIHPKMMRSESFNILNEYISTNQIKFIKL